jgi:uncharacterized membrane protein YbhN (UPF0104 family)
MSSLPSRKPDGAASAEDVPRLGGRRLWLTLGAMVLGVAAVIVLVSLNAEDVGDALALASLGQVAALVGLHMAALVLRAEAWGLCLTAAGKPLSRRRLHAASSLRFLADTTVPTYVGAWVRIAILKRLEGSKAPTIGQMISADGVLLLIEALITVVLLVGCSVLAGLDWYWPLVFALAAAAALGGVLILRRRFAGRAFVRVFDVLSDSQHRVPLTILLTVVLTIQPVRFYISLHAVGLDANALQSLLTFVTTSAINALPIGPGPASVGATVSVFGRDGVGAATASGLVLAATAFVAAGVYSVWGAIQLLRTRREADAEAEAAATKPAHPADAA